ncbi:GFA family protein [Litoribrevibacter albus]|uniref:Aldehyde-activating protein n=1 Tax=Litoribrevibacter albus TaxID=1473156 RepID=A0AA37S6B6_9GAMM|nr:GFA family protein [Litoribrevibacter albus]GLQ29970.1 aldehyde-activating protein [Litoribrevibacter albus]
MKMHKGSCLCGSVVFELAGEFDSFVLCHCQHCQKDTGSAHAANLFSTSGTLTWLKGRGLVKTFQLPETQHSKSFCQNCGSSVPTHAEKLGFVVVPAGCLDTPIAKTPNAKIFMRSQTKWSKCLENVQSFEALPE